MCEPTLITMTIGTVLTTAAGIYSSKTRKAEGKYQASLAVQKAEKARKDAAYERQTGIEEARNQRLQAILNMGEEKANIASANLSTNSQTALNILDDSKLNGELDALTTLKKSDKRANDIMFNSGNYYSGAALTSFAARRNYVSNSLGQSGSFFNSIANSTPQYMEEGKKWIQNIKNKKNK